jgi:hypothetical protein
MLPKGPSSWNILLFFQSFHILCSRPPVQPVGGGGEGVALAGGGQRRQQVAERRTGRITVGRQCLCDLSLGVPADFLLLLLSTLTFKSLPTALCSMVENN